MSFGKNNNEFNDFAFNDSIDKSIESSVEISANLQQGDIIEMLTPKEVLVLILEITGVEGKLKKNHVHVPLGKHMLVVRPQMGWTDWSEEEPAKQIVVEVQLSKDLRFHDLKLLNEFNSRIYGVKVFVNVDDAICVNTLVDMEYGLPIELICDLIRQTVKQAKIIYLSPAIGIFDERKQHSFSREPH